MNVTKIHGNPDLGLEWWIGSELKGNELSHIVNVIEQNGFVTLS